MPVVSRWLGRSSCIQYIFKSRYARYLDDKGRRENWPETVNRYLDFFEGRFPKVVKPLRNDLYNAIHDLEVMPSVCVV